MRRLLLAALASALAIACGNQGSSGPEDPGPKAEDVVAPDKLDVPATPDDGVDSTSKDEAIPDGYPPPDGTSLEEGQESEPDTFEIQPETAEGVPDDAIEDEGPQAPEDVTDTGPVPCLSDLDCNDGDPCTTDTCNKKKGKCEHAKATCDPGLECFTGACAEGGCHFDATFSEACFATPAVFMADIEKLPLGQWVVEDLAKNQPAGKEIVWQPSESRAHSGTHSLYFGDPVKKNYDTGKLVAAAARTPPVTPKAGEALRLVVWVWVDVEDGDLWDVLSFAVETVNTTVPVWTKKYGFPAKTWTPVVVDLSAFAGETFRVVATFNSVEGSFNDTEGVYLDDFFVLRLAKQPACAKPEDCDDGVPCTKDECTAGACAHDFSSGCCGADLDCEDYDACTIDVCESGECKHVEVADPLCCNADPDCDDHNECTIDKCAKNKCQYSTSDVAGCCSNDAQCNDGDPCTKDGCTLNTCQHINTCCKGDAECDDNDDKCTTDSCVAGKCVFKPTGVPGCCTPIVAKFDFEDGGPGWEFTPKTAGVGWQVSSGLKSVSPASALYYGDPQKGNFETGSQNAGTAWSPAITLPPGYPIGFEAWVYMDTEAGDYYDKLTISVESEGVVTVPVWVKGYVSTGQFFSVSANLSAWAGKTVKLRIDFDTMDSVANSGQGVFVDDVAFTTTCAPASCTIAGDCNDGLKQTKDLCDGGICSYEFTGSAGCISDGECDDGDYCTIDYCKGGQCIHEFDPWCWEF